MIDLRAQSLCCLVVVATLASAVLPSFAQADKADAAATSAANASSASASLSARFPGGTISSERTADEALAAARNERANIEARYVADQRACHERFFVTSCIEVSRERHRIALEQVRPVEVEAEKVKRQLRVVERDKALAEKRAQIEAEAPERAQRQLDSERTATEKAQERAQQAAEAQASEKEHAADVARRTAEHQERLQRAKAEEAANAQKRAENTAAYEQKLRAAKEHQAEVEAKQKARELERQNKATP